jgi:tetratricopeptide (TPR) repeat protein
MFNCRIVKIILFFTILYAPSSQISAQKSTKEIDSLTKLVEKNYIQGDNDPEKVLKYTTELYYLSRDAGYTPGQMNSVFEESRIYYLKGDFDTALNKISKGIDLAKSQQDYNMLCRFLLIYQKLLLQLDYLRESQNVLDKCKEINALVSQPEERHINMIYILLGQADLMVDNIGMSTDMKSVLSLKKKAYTEAIKINNSNKSKKITLIYTLEALAWSTALSDNLEEARKNTSQIDKLLLQYPNESLIVRNLITKGAIENKAQNYAMALGYFSESIKKSKGNIYILHEVYPMISVSYGQLDDFKNSTIYSWKYKHVTDQINQIKKRSGDANIIYKINAKIFDKARNIPYINHRTFDILLVIVIICAGSYLVYKNIYKIKIFLNSIFFRNKNIRERAMQNEELSSIEAVTVPDLNELETTRSLIRALKEDVNLFYLEFQRAYPDFYIFIKEKYPQLTISDINFCSLIKMNLGVKEISVYTKSSVRSVESRRYRIIKKMDLNSQKDLYFIISMIK